MVFIEFFEEIMDFSPWYSSNFSKKSWTIVHGFHQVFEEIMDYSPWYSSNFSKKSWTVVHGIHRIFRRNHGL